MDEGERAAAASMNGRSITIRAFSGVELECIHSGDRWQKRGSVIERVEWRWAAVRFMGGETGGSRGIAAGRSNELNRDSRCGRAR